MQPGSEPIAAGALGESEDGRADVLDRHVELVDRRLDTPDDLGIAAGQPNRALQRQARREEALDDRVVQISGDPLAVVDERQGLHRAVQPGVVDRHCGGAGQSDGELLVEFAELVAVDLVRQVQVSEHLVADPDRHAEERAHRRMVGREPDAVGMGAEIGKP